MMIGLEGAVGTLHPEYLNFFSDYPEANLAVVSDLKKKGELNGAELFAWQRYKDGGRRMEDGVKTGSAPSAIRHPLSVFGVENAALYRDNLKTTGSFSETERNRKTPRRGPEPAESESSKKLNADLRDFLKERSRRKDGRFGLNIQSDPNLQTYAGYLKKQSLKFLGIDLEDAIEQLRFPNLMRVLKIAGAPAKFDAARSGGVDRSPQSIDLFGRRHQRK